MVTHLFCTSFFYYFHYYFYCSHFGRAQVKSNKPLDAPERGSGEDGCPCVSAGTMASIPRVRVCSRVKLHCQRVLVCFPLQVTPSTNGPAAAAWSRCSRYTRTTLPPSTIVATSRATMITDCCWGTVVVVVVAAQFLDDKFEAAQQ